MEEQFELLQNWNTMLKNLDKARKCWEKLEGSLKLIDSTGVSPTTTRAMTISIQSRSFEMMLPDLIRFWRTHGGFEMLVVDQKLVDSFKPKEEKD